MLFEAKQKMTNVKVESEYVKFDNLCVYATVKHISKDIGPNRLETRYFATYTWYFFTKNWTQVIIIFLVLCWKLWYILIGFIFHSFSFHRILWNGTMLYAVPTIIASRWHTQELAMRSVSYFGHLDLRIMRRREPGSLFFIHGWWLCACNNPSLVNECRTLLGSIWQC